MLVHSLPTNIQRVLTTPSKPLLPTNDPEFLGHPKGLLYLFFAELWERFSFYGMRALLIIYMTKVFLFSDTMSYGIYAAYGSLVYATPLIGGMLADRVLGYRRAILFGGILMAVGHFLLAFQEPFFFYASLAFIVVGNGFFKPNISSFVGSLYKKGDHRRDGGFLIFYLGINLGGALAPLLCAWLATKYGWHFGFGLAGIGMLLGLLVFQRGLKSDVFEGKGLPPARQEEPKKLLGLEQGALTMLLSVLALPLMALLIKFYEYEHFLIWVVAIGVLGGLAYLYAQSTQEDRKKLLAISYFTGMATLFIAIFEQGGSSITLFADRNVNLQWFSAAQTNSFNSGFIILLVFPFAFLWRFLAKSNRNPSSPVKFGLGLVLVGLSFMLFASSARQADSAAMVPMTYLVLGYLVLTAGELFISPVGLSKMTELSPPKFVSFIMGVWFLSSFFGHFFSGKIARLTSVSVPGEGLFDQEPFASAITWITGLSVVEIETMGESHQHLYGFVSTFAGFGLLTTLVGIIGLLVARPIRKLMAEVH